MTGDRAAWLIRNVRPLGGDPTDLLLRDGLIVDAGSGLSAPRGPGR